MSGRGTMIGGLIAWTEALVTCPRQLQGDELAEWIGHRFNELMDAPPQRLSPGTLEAVARIYPGQSIPSLKMIWQRFKRCQCQGRGAPPMVALPWAALIGRDRCP